MQLTCPSLIQHSGLRHGFFTRRGGVSHGLYSSLNCGYGSGDESALVQENRARIARALHAGPDALLTTFQIHSAQAVWVDTPWHWQNAPEADALVTNQPGIALGILTADCLPILLSDPVSRIIAAVHAGWKGAFGGIIENTVGLMCERGAQPAQIHATIGPSIAQGSYEVGNEFYERFTQQDIDNKIYFIHGARDGHYLFDLKSYAKERLRNASIAHINILAHDTCLEENDFFSYRRATLRGESAYGRQLSVIMLEER